MKSPSRAFELNIKIGGDTWEDVLRNLRELASHVEDHGSNCNSVSGGYSSHHIVDVRIRPDLTHDQYSVELEEYLKNLRSPNTVVEEPCATQT